MHVDPDEVNNFFQVKPALTRLLGKLKYLQGIKISLPVSASCCDCPSYFGFWQDCPQSLFLLRLLCVINSFLPRLPV